MKFTEKELHAIDAAMAIAAQVYDEDAKFMDESQQPLVARQFREQADFALAIACKIGMRETKRDGTSIYSDLEIVVPPCRICGVGVDEPCLENCTYEGVF